jgi:hypothetical protein
MAPKEIIELSGGGLLVAYLLFLLWRMSTHRRPDISGAELLLAGPMLFIRPERYFPEGKLRKPWRYFAWWFIGAALIVATTYQVAEMAGSRVAT